MEELLAWIARGLVDDPDAVQVERVDDGDVVILRLQCRARRRRQGDRASGPRRAGAPHRRPFRRGARRPPPRARDRGLARRMDPDRLVPIGRVGRPHGLDGAFVVEHASDDDRALGGRGGGRRRRHAGGDHPLAASRRRPPRHPARPHRRAGRRARRSAVGASRRRTPTATTSSSSSASSSSTRTEASSGAWSRCPLGRGQRQPRARGRDARADDRGRRSGRSISTRDGSSSRAAFSARGRGYPGSPCASTCSRRFRTPSAGSPSRSRSRRCSGASSSCGS